jgi:hypothetical protein
MKKVTITRNRIVALKQHFSDVSEITPEKGGTIDTDCPHCGQRVTAEVPHEPFGKVQTFKWRAARNAEKCKQVAHSFSAGLDAIMAETPAMATYFAEQEALFKRFQKIDADGKPVAANPDGSIPVDETRADEIKAEMVVLKTKHAEALAGYEAQRALAKEYMEAPVEIELMTVAVNDLPRKISGAWMLVIAEMLDGLPTEGGGE